MRQGLKLNLRVPKRVSRLLKNKNQGIKIDLGCGENKQDKDFVGIDKRRLKGVDIIHDLEKFPYPLPSECATLVVASQLVEHINPAGGIFLKFMDEIWRLLKIGGKLVISTPYAGSPYYWQDPTHINGCNEATWAYFDPTDLSNLYNIYRPKPYKIEFNSWANHGFMEVVLRKLDEKEVKKQQEEKMPSANQPAFDAKK